MHRKCEVWEYSFGDVLAGNRQTDRDTDRPKDLNTDRHAHHNEQMAHFRPRRMRRTDVAIVIHVVLCIMVSVCVCFCASVGVCVCCTQGRTEQNGYTYRDAVWGGIVRAQGAHDFLTGRATFAGHVPDRYPLYSIRRCGVQ